MNQFDEFIELDTTYPTLMRAIQLIPNLKYDVTSLCRAAVKENQEKNIRLIQDILDKSDNPSSYVLSKDAKEWLVSIVEQMKKG